MSDKNIKISHLNFFFFALINFTFITNFDWTFLNLAFFRHKKNYQKLHNYKVSFYSIYFYLHEKKNVLNQSSLFF